MKKIFSFALAAFAALSINAAQLDLPLGNLVSQDAGATSWGNTSFDAATNTLSLSDWNSSGHGWWIADDWSAYDRIVVEFDQAAPTKIQIVVEYYGSNTDQSDGMDKMACNPGDRSIAIELNASKKARVQKVFLQAEASCSIVLKKAYATSEAEENPVEGLTGVEMRQDEWGYVPLALIRQYSYIEVVLKVTLAGELVTYGIGEIVPVSNYDVKSYTFICKKEGVGSLNRYLFTQAEFLEFAKVNGEFYTDTEYQRQGVHIKAYEDKAELVSVLGYGDAAASDTRPRTDLGTPDDQYHVVHLTLDIINAYDEFELLINVTNPQVEASWGLGKIVPYNYWTGTSFEYKGTKNGVGEQTITISKADMLNYAKVNGEYYTDPDSGNQGVTIQAYADHAVLIKVMGVGGGNAPQAVENIIAAPKARKVLRNGVLYIERDGVRHTVTGVAL